MAFRRGITAFVIALVLTLALGQPLLAMVYMNMLPAPGHSGRRRRNSGGLVGMARRLDTGPPGAWRWLRLGLFVDRALRAAFGVLHRFPRLERAGRRPDCSAGGLGGGVDSAAIARPQRSAASTAKPVAA